MIVKETRISFDVSDILRVIIRCDKCNGEISYPTGADLPDMTKCPICPAPWDVNGVERTKDREHIVSLMNVLEHFAYRNKRREGRTPLWSIRLELPGDMD